MLAGDIADPRLGLGEDRLRPPRGRGERGPPPRRDLRPRRSRRASPSRSTSRAPATCSTFCRDAERLDRLNYVSTAYVAGDRTGVVYEHELDLGQGFKNHYESTKFQAEVWVRSLIDRIPTTIFRPAIVVGDSRTGETQKFDGPYYVLRFIAATGEPRDADRQHRPRRDALQRRPGRLHRRRDGGARPRRPTRSGRPFTSATPSPLSSARDGRAAHRPLSGPARRPTGCRRAVVAAALRFGPIRDLYGGTPAESIRYLNHPVRYDTRRADELLAASRSALPALPRVRPGDGRLLPRARGRSGAGAGGGFPVTTGAIRG